MAMNLGQLRRAVEAFPEFGDDTEVVVSAPIMDDDGDDIETWCALQTVSIAMNPDTKQEYIRLACDREFDQQ